jgi:hypothetical protein
LGLVRRRGLDRRKAGPNDEVAKHETLPACFQRTANSRHSLCVSRSTAGGWSEQREEPMGAGPSSSFSN